MLMECIFRTELTTFPTISGSIKFLYHNLLTTYNNNMALNDNHSTSAYDWLFVGPKGSITYSDNYSSSDGDVMWQ